MSHARDFGLESGNKSQATQLILDYRKCGFNSVDNALCEFAIKLTLDPDRMDAEDIEKLKSLGLDDHQITVAVQVISYFNYINRIADSLGIEPEDFMKEAPQETWHAEKANFRNDPAT